MDNNSQVKMEPHFVTSYMEDLLNIQEQWKAAWLNKVSLLGLHIYASQVDPYLKASWQS